MKRALLFVPIAMGMVLMSPVLMAKKKTPPPAPAAEIHWITSIDELQAKMAKQPRKVYMDVYTDWCGWCKKMDATTFSNKNVVNYMNTNYYCFKFNAERKDTLHFQGQSYYFQPEYRANSLAAKLMLGASGQGQMSYPTTILMMENFQNPQPIPGFMTVSQLEPVLTYFGDNVYKHQTWDAYSKSHKANWEDGQPQDMTPPAGH